MQISFYISINLSSFISTENNPLVDELQVPVIQLNGKMQIIEGCLLAHRIEASEYSYLMQHFVTLTSNSVNIKVRRIHDATL